MRQGLKITEDEFEKASKEYRSLAQQIYDGIPSKLDRTEQARRLKEKLDSYLIWRDLAKNLPAELDTSKWFDTLKHAFAFRYVDNRAKATHNRTRSDSPPSPSPSISPGRRPASQLERPEQLESVMKKKKKAIISAPSNGRSLLTENASRISNLEDYNNQPVSDLGLSEFIQPPDESINSGMFWSTTLFFRRGEFALTRCLQIRLASNHLGPRMPPCPGFTKPSPREWTRSMGQCRNQRTTGMLRRIWKAAA